MRIICGWPQSESMSPLVLTALKLANLMELFAAELRPFAQQRSPFGDYSKSFPRSEGIRRSAAHRKATSFTRVRETHLSEKRWQRQASRSHQRFGNPSPEEKCLKNPQDQQPTRRCSLPWPGVTFMTSFVAMLNGKFAFASIFPALRQRLGAPAYGCRDPNRAVTVPEEHSVTNGWPGRRPLVDQ